MSKKPGIRKLSELEGVVLGIVSQSQSCTAYSVRVKLKEAPSSHWRASAGAVYPLLARLEAEKYLSSTSDRVDGRGRSFLSITSLGRRALKSWVKSGTDYDVISSLFDPVRSRAFFLGALSAAERVRYAEGMIDAMQQYLEVTTDHLNKKSERDDLYEYLGSLGAQMSMETRLKWLKIVREKVG